MPGMTSAPRKGRRDLEPVNCLNKAGADCETVRTKSDHGVYHPGAFNGGRLPNGSLSPTTQRRGGGDRRGYSHRIRSQLGGTNQESASSNGVWAIPGATGEAGLDTQRGRRPATAGHTGAGGQDRATCRGDGTGGHIRAALLRVLVWLSASLQRAHRDWHSAATVSKAGHQLDN